ncbi:MAG: hypothetical protein MZU84_09175 [Sphingobacterium sp.]|nr:hypothetical protein [Sphingobacterium sp.]
MSIGLYEQAIRYFERAVSTFAPRPSPLGLIAQCWSTSAGAKGPRPVREKPWISRGTAPVVCAMHIGLLTLLGHLDEADTADRGLCTARSSRTIASQFFRTGFGNANQPGKSHAFGSGEPHGPSGDLSSILPSAWRRRPWLKPSTRSGTTGYRQRCTYPSSSSKNPRYKSPPR